MKLLTYRIDQKKGNVRDKLYFLRNLYLEALENDKLWHFFLHEGGGTLRFQKKFENRVVNYIKNERPNGFRYKKMLVYSPERHEYYGISFLKDEILPLFHDLSVLAASYPPEVGRWPVLERLCHTWVNQTGVHDFLREALIYLELADRRSSIWNLGLPYPKWLYKLYFRFLNLKRKYLVSKKKK